MVVGRATESGLRQGGTARAALREDRLRRAARPTGTALGRGATSTCVARLAGSGRVKRSASASCREEKEKHQPRI